MYMIYQLLWPLFHVNIPYPYDTLRVAVRVVTRLGQKYTAIACAVYVQLNQFHILIDNRFKKLFVVWWNGIDSHLDLAAFVISNLI